MRHLKVANGSTLTSPAEGRMPAQLLCYIFIDWGSCGTVDQCAFDFGDCPGKDVCLADY